MKKIVISLYLIVVTLNTSCAQEIENKVSEVENPPFTAELFIDNLQQPWGLTFMPDGAILVTEIEGKILYVKNDIRTEISNVPDIYRRGQGGLMDIALHPKYSENGWIYFTYASEGEGEEKGGNTTLMRAKLKDNALVEKQLLYKATPNTTKGQHFGSRIAFDNDGYLYFSVGDRGDRDVNPQDITRDGGKIYRLNDDGTIPTDNPFVNSEDAKKAIYSYGHRNPQGLVKNPETGEIWNHEHGPQGGDEINIIKKGANFGWPLITYGINYSGTPITDKTAMEGMEQPVHYWVPSIAPSGMAFISTDMYAGMKGNLLVGSLKFQYVENVIFENNKVVKREKLLPEIGRVRDIKEGPDGFMYIAVEGKGIYKLVPNK